ncbi:MAG: fructose-6-phosphate aldolase [Deltaproteobacteria bacterium]|nr:fructose-6-phosphate aldolase [Deltaproteobacteria bacterium]
MKLFLDTASLAEIERLAPLGLVDGVTSNPALLAREPGEPLDVLRAIAARVAGPVSAQVTHGDAKEMVAQGRGLAALAPNVVVKLPADRAGLEAARTLGAEGIPCNVTLCFEPAQIVAFARVPVAYVSLILGRTEDFGLGDEQRVADAASLLARLGSPTELLVASVRNPGHLRLAALAGAHVATVPPATWDLVLDHPLTGRGLDDFARSWLTLPAPRRAAYDALGTPCPGAC